MKVSVMVIIVLTFVFGVLFLISAKQVIGEKKREQSLCGLISFIIAAFLTAILIAL